MPKGVAWRNEDLFFAALSAAVGPSLAPGDQRRKMRGGLRLSEHDRRPVDARCRPVGHVQHALRRRRRGPLHPAAASTPTRCGTSIERERCIGPHPRGRRHGPALADALADGSAPTTSPASTRIGSGGGVFSPAVQQALKDHSRTSWCRPATAPRRWRRGMSAEGGARRFSVSDESRRAPRGPHPVRPEEIGHAGPHAATSRSATTRTTRRRRRPSRSTPPRSAVVGARRLRR